MSRTPVLVGVFAVLAACSTPATPADTGLGTDASGPRLPAGPVALNVGQVANYTITNLDDAQAYRITLVLDANLTLAADGTGTFLDLDLDGAADAGLSEEVANVTSVNGVDVPAAKTTPASTDDPAAPTGVFPVGGQIAVQVLGVGPGVVRPVAYVNGGATTFLEVDAAGLPVEVYGIGGPLTVSGEAADPEEDEITVSPGADETIAVGATTTFTASGLDDALAYRITLVMAENLTRAADGTATFLDADASGTADSGTSELVANITTVNGDDVTPTKTVPGSEDDPAAPSGVYPTGGEISVEILGLAAGEVHPVVYVNAGGSTFLELDAGGAPTEAYAVGNLLGVE